MKHYNSILIVEDDLVFCKILTNFLNKNGFPSQDCQTADEAMDRVKNLKVDLVVADYKLPDSNGLNLLKEISSISPDTDTILMSRYEKDSISDNTTFSPSLGFLRKPFDPQDLIDMLN